MSEQMARASMGDASMKLGICFISKYRRKPTFLQEDTSIRKPKRFSIYLWHHLVHSQKQNLEKDAGSPYVLRVSPYLRFK